MKYLLEKLEILLKKGLITRRQFLKYAGTLGSVSIIGRGLDRTGSKALAQTNPRVVSVHNSNATDWDYVTGYHWEYINQTVVNDMVARGVMTLTNTSNIEDAWSSLIPYQPGEAIAIKVNFNNSHHCESGGDYNQMDAYAETANAIVNALISIDVPPDKIWIADPSRGIPDRFIDRISNPNVQFYSTSYTCSQNSHLTDYVDADSPDASPTTHPADDVVRPAQVLVDAQHLINIPLLKGHGEAQITLGLKNHYGSVIFKNYPTQDQYTDRVRLHEYIFPNKNSDIEKSTLADISNNPHIRDKTRLIIGDGLFGDPIDNVRPPQRWEIFNNDDSNILFFGTDPIATDSVMCDYISEEQIREIGMTPIHSSLHYGSALGLGVHDHWDSFEAKQYSLIDYIQIECDNKRLIIDQTIRRFKEGEATLEEVLTEIESYMQGS